MSEFINLNIDKYTVVMKKVEKYNNIGSINKLIKITQYSWFFFNLMNNINISTHIFFF